MGRIDEIAGDHTPQEMYEMGKEYLDGMNGFDGETVKMPAKAMKYFIKAAEHGHVEAQYELALMYENGIGSEPDIEKAIEWYKAAASHNHPKAKKALERLKCNTTEQTAPEYVSPDVSTQDIV